MEEFDHVQIIANVGGEKSTFIKKAIPAQASYDRQLLQPFLRAQNLATACPSACKQLTSAFVGRAVQKTVFPCSPTPFELSEHVEW